MDHRSPSPTRPGSNVNAVFEEGYAKGAALFNRLEGTFYADRSIFFVSTSGGTAKNGDINTTVDEAGPPVRGGVRADLGVPPRRGPLELLFESPGGSVLDSPDNMAISPRGGIVLCEDDASDGNHAQPGEDPDFDVSPYHGGSRNRLVGLTLDGDAFPFAENMLTTPNWPAPAGAPTESSCSATSSATTSPGSGGTVAITGPWHKGAL